MKQVHMILQGKGGVGKSLIATLLAQWLASKGEVPACIDTDPLNATFAGYRALDVEHLQLLEDTKVVERKFDTMMERIFAEDRHFVIDNGSSSYLPISSYIVENDVPQMIHEQGKELVVHTVVTGGANLLDNVNSFTDLAKQMPEPARLVVWVNGYFGPVEMDGKTFEDMAAYNTYRARVHGLIQLERHESDTVREDLEQLFKAKMTFAEADQSAVFGVMPKQRFRQVSRRWFERMDSVL